MCAVTDCVFATLRQGDYQAAATTSSAQAFAMAEATALLLKPPSGRSPSDVSALAARLAELGGLMSAPVTQLQGMAAHLLVCPLARGSLVATGTALTSQVLHVLSGEVRMKSDGTEAAELSQAAAQDLTAGQAVMPAEGMIATCATDVLLAYMSKVRFDNSSEHTAKAPRSVSG